MKKRQIKAAIDKKVNDWLNSIESNDVQTSIRDNIIVTGGCIVSMLLNERVRDYDVYFSTPQAAHAAASYYATRASVLNSTSIHAVLSTEPEPRVVISRGAGGEPYTSTGAEDLDLDEADEMTEVCGKVDPTEKPYQPIYLTPNAITLSGGIQLVLRFIGSPEEIHKNYDFVHCTNYWHSAEKTVTLNQAALEAILAKELKYVGSKYPVCSLFRLRKFIQRGWSCHAGTVLKIAMQISDLDLHDYKTFREQLIGVDATYFGRLVDAAHERNPEVVETTLIAKLVDEIFS